MHISLIRPCFGTDSGMNLINRDGGGGRVRCGGGGESKVGKWVGSSVCRELAR